MMPLNDSATELIRRCRAGEAQAREALFDRYRAYLRILAEGQLGRHLRAKCDASDIVQQTLLEAHRDFPTFQGAQEPELLGWLRRILAHNLFNEARRFTAKQRDTAREISLDQVQGGLEQSSMALGRCLPDQGPSPSQLATQREAAVHLADTLAQLPERYQTVIVLRIFEGMSAEEVAERMETSPGAVRMLQMRALTMLREIMSPSQGEVSG